MRQWFPERAILAGLAAIAAIGVAGWITYSRVQILNNSAGWVTHSQQVRFALERTLSTLQDAESGIRAYVITRNQAYLEPYGHIHAELAADLRTLTSLVADNPRQVARALELERLAQARTQILEETVASIRAGTFEPPKDPLAQTEGKRRMDAVHAQIAVMQAEEDALLQQRLVRVERARTAALTSAAATIAVAVTLVLLLLIVDRRATASLRRSEGWLSTTLSSIGDGVIATDATGAVRFLNPVAEELTGWSESQGRGRPLETVFRIVSEDTRASVENPVARVLREGVIVGLANHTLLMRRDGTEFPIEDSAAPIKDENGGVSGVVLVFKDASRARVAERAIRASEERLRLALEGARLGAWDLNLVTDQAVWNDQLYRIMGHVPGIPITSDMAWLRPLPEDRKPVEEALEHARREHLSFELDHRILRASDGEVRWIWVHGNFLYDDQGVAVRFVGIARDVTEQRQLEQRVRQTQKLDALGTLAGGIAHDFNNILAILRGNLTLVSMDVPSEHAITPALREMSAACERATALVRQILAFGSRHELGRQIVQLEAVVAESLRLLRATLPATIELRAQYAADLPPVSADANQIHQVIANLGTNAAHAIGDNVGIIEAEVDSLHVDAAVAATSSDLSEGRYVRLRFSDNGSGMTPEVLERIFEPFFTTKPPDVGSGLGLPVVRGILKSHGAAFSVYSEPERGTRFHLYFPIAGPTAGNDGPATGSAVPGIRRGRGERILYLDDEEALVALSKRLLEQMGYRVSGFTDAQEALSAFRAVPDEFDLVLTDLSMPGASGIEIARQVLAIRPDIPVLLATGYVRDGDAERARHVGIREVIWKPQTAGEMSEVMAAALEKAVRK